MCGPQPEGRQSVKAKQRAGHARPLLDSVLAYTRPTYLLYHFLYGTINPDYAQILHIKLVRSANRRNPKAVI